MSGEFHKGDVDEARGVQPSVETSTVRSLFLELVT